MSVSVVALPTSPPPLSATMRPLSFATEMGGASGAPLGGPTQRVLRVGSRFAVDYEMPAMPYDAARQWLARLLSGEANPVAMRFPQRGLNPLNPSASDFVRVSGPQTATQNTGGVLNVRNGGAGVQLLSGQFFSLLAQADGRRYVHQVRDDVAFAPDGTATLAIQPPLRVVPADGDTMEFVAPLIEGFVTMNWAWTIEQVRRVGLKFTVTEDR